MDERGQARKTGDAVTAAQGYHELRRADEIRAQLQVPNGGPTSPGRCKNFAEGAVLA
jgi:hypothetical protein